MFSGFYNETFDFLYGIAFNNERIWFSEHKEEYETYLYRPLVELSKEVFPRLAEKYPDEELQCRVTRIYRDARLYHGINCFKESLWFTIMGPAPAVSMAPSLWFEVRRDGWDYGMGFYRPSAATMARHRAAIDRDSHPLSKLRQRLLTQDEFILQGERYAKFKPGAPPNLASWYNMKNFSLIHQEYDVRPLFDGPKLVKRLVDGFSFLMPYYRYFYPLSDAAHQD